MKKIARICAIALAISLIPISTFATSVKISFSQGSRYVYSATGHNIKGSVSYADGQYVVLYNGKGKAISYQKLPSTQGKASFNFTAPKLSYGKNNFYIMSTKHNAASKSSVYKVVIHYKRVKVPLTSYVFSKKGSALELNAKGENLKYSSSNRKVATVSAKGKVVARKAGNATITVSSGGEKTKVYVRVPAINSYNKATKPIMDACKTQSKWMKNYTYAWGRNPCTIEGSKKSGTCVTYTSVVMQRLRILKPGQAVWQSSRGKVDSVIKPYTTTTYPKKSPSRLKGTLKQGDIIMHLSSEGIQAGQASHIMIFSHFKNGKMYVWDNHTVKSWKPHKYSSSVNSITRVNTFNVYASGVNCSISDSSLVLARQNKTVRYRPIKGKKIKAIYVNGKKVSPKAHPSSYTFRDIKKTQTIKVICQ